MDRHFSDPILKAIMLATVTFYHDRPYELGLIQYLTAQGSYYLGGGHVIRGGSQTMSDFLAKVIVENGGEVILNHNVDRLVTENNRVCAVEFHKTRGEQRESKVVSCQYLVANAPMPNVYRDLLGDSVSLKKFEMLKSYGESVSATNVFFGLSKSLKELGNTSYMNIFIDSISSIYNQEAEGRHFGLMNHGVIESGLCPAGIYSSDLIYMDRMSHWRGLSEVDYRSKKQRIADYFSDRIDQLYPGFKSAIDLVEVGTPRTMERYTRNPNGTAYAFLPSAESFSRRCRELFDQGYCVDEQFENLYFASAWSHIPGHAGTAVAGSRAAAAILEREGQPPIYSV